MGFQIKTVSGVEWEQLTGFSDDPFTSLVYSNAVSSASRLKCDCIAVSDSNNFMAGCKVYYRKQSGLSVCSHPPLTPYNSFLVAPGLSDDVSNNATKNLLDYISRHYIYPYFLLRPQFAKLQSVNWITETGQTYIVDPSVDRLDSDIKRRARKCEASGFYVSRDYRPEWFCKLYEGTINRQKISGGISAANLEKLINDVAPIAKMYSSFNAEHNLHSCWIQLSINKNAVYNWMATANVDYLSSGGTPFLVSAIRKDFEKEGFAKWDLCGADIPSVARFKASIGGEMYPYYKLRSAPYSVVKRALYKFARMIS